MTSRVNQMFTVILMTIPVLLMQAGALGAGEQFSGRGDHVTPEFTPPLGLYVLHMKHLGRSNFAIRPLSTDGSVYPSLVNKIGGFDGSAVFSVRETKTFVLSVDADGSWSISIEEPGRDPHARYFSGKGQAATKLISLEGGIYIFSMKHTGKGNFIICPYGTSGRRYSSLINEIGPFEGWNTVPFEEGEYLFQVDADGDWEMSIEKQ